MKNNNTLNLTLKQDFLFKSIDYYTKIATAPGSELDLWIVKLL